MVTDAKRRCTARYQAKIKKVLVSFNLQELSAYERLRQHCMHENRSIQAYIKELIWADMKLWEDSDSV